MSITGTVLVEYTVHPDGSVGEISMRNNGPPILFGAVKKWLEECSFSPSLSGVKPIPVKVIQPFVFQMKG
jgi:outer membrane biosynthesis protein TonB